MTAPTCPDWMWEGQGFLDVQLELRSLYDIRSIRKLYHNYKHLYPWVLFWGQNWWARRPVYLDTKGLDLTSIPSQSKVEVTRFQDRDGLSLFAISNPNLVAGLAFRFNGISIGIPVQKIAVVE